MQSASVCAPRPFLGVCSAFANVEVAETTKSEIRQDGRNWLDDLASLPQLDELDHVLLHVPFCLPSPILSYTSTLQVLHMLGPLKLHT